MKDLEELRKNIDECDRQIVEALEERFSTVKDIIAYKRENNVPILQSSREDEIFKKVESYQDSREFLEEIKSIYIYILKKSKEIQKKELG